MQRFFKILLKINFLLFLINPQLLYSQGLNKNLASADALYKRGNYTEAYQIYEKILLEEQHFTPAMLLKMAHIKKGLQQYSEALYLLNLYHSHFPEQSVQNEIMDIAEEQKLVDYKINDWEYIILVYRKYKLFFHGAMLLGIFSGVFWLYYRQHHQKDSLYQSILLNLLIAAYFYVYNYALSYPKAIVRNEKVYLMEAPSAAAKIVSKTQKGNCMQIIEKNDIWYKVRWQEKDETWEGYIRESNLYLIP